MPLTVSLIVAASENGVIGRGGVLPWRLSTDLKLFRRLTMGKPLIMGRKTFASIGKPLDGRDNIVLTRDAGWSAEGVHVAADLDAALVLAERLAQARGVEEVMVIGGAEIYRAALPRAQRIYLTRVHATVEGDTTLPGLPAAEWREAGREALPQGPKDEHAATLVVLERPSTGR